MTSLSSITISAFLLVVATFIAACSCADNTVDSESDVEFQKFLDDAMTKYGDWLQSNGQDPSEPLTDTLTLSGKNAPPSASLTCDIQNQRIISHSKNGYGVISAESNFAEHHFSAGRVVSTPYQFQGDLNCSGVVVETGKDYEMNIKFVATGKWSIVCLSSEVLQVTNVGISAGNRFDLSKSWTNYVFTPNLYEIQFDGQWDDGEFDGEIDKYTEQILRLFRDMYFEHLVANKENDLHPSKRLLENYLVDHLINNTLVSEIIPVNPPPVFVPTPSSSTTPETTTSHGTSSTLPSTGLKCGLLLILCYRSLADNTD